MRGCNFLLRQNYIFISQIWLTNLFYRKAKPILPVLLLPVSKLNHRLIRLFLALEVIFCKCREFFFEKDRLEVHSKDRRNKDG